MSRTDNACLVCGRVDYPHFHSLTAASTWQATTTRVRATHTFEWCDECECYEPVPVRRPASDPYAGSTKTHQKAPR